MATTRTRVRFTVAEYHCGALPVRVVVVDDEPWFLALDVATLAGIPGRWQSVRWMVAREDLIELDYRYLTGATDLRPARNGGVTFVSESGAYQVALLERHPESRTFRRWFLSELLPTIRAQHPPSVHRVDLPIVRRTEVIVNGKPQPSAYARKMERQPHALYRLYDAGGELLYVGISLTFAARFAHHASTQSWWPQVANIGLETHPNRSAALDAETAAIRSEHPRYNVAGTT